VPTISIKINGLRALNDGQLIGGAKLNGANLAMMGEDGNRALLAKKALMRGGEIEMEGKRMILLQPSNGAGAGMKGGLASSGAGAVGTKSAIVTNATPNATMSGAATTSGGSVAKSAGAATVSAKGMGWKLALGGFGPWLVLGSLGIAAVGLYFYLRAERMAMEAAANESPFDELEDH
jgi:hypothetical protein